MAHRRKWATMVGVALVAVVVLDQVTKWWAWRHAPVAHINEGGNPFVGDVIGSWFADPTIGAFLDLMDFGLLTTALVMLSRRAEPAIIWFFSAVMIAGWSSNLLDRLGLHHVTAPGSYRGAVDFIHIGPYYFNVADFFIAGATLAFLVAAAHLGVSRRFVSVTPLQRETV
jgi:lipoprotein signal peptidase